MAKDNELPRLPTREEYKTQGFSKAEVEILVKLARIEERVEIICKNYVSRKEFEPVQRIVYGMVGVILVGVFVAIVALVIR